MGEYFEMVARMLIMVGCRGIKKKNDETEMKKMRQEEMKNENKDGEAEECEGGGKIRKW